MKPPEKEKPNNNKRKRNTGYQKRNLERAECKKIPKHKLESALQIIADDNYEMWNDKNTSCTSAIHLAYQKDTSVIVQSVEAFKLEYARKCLLKRDWVNLIKVLLMMESSRETGYLYPLLTKYAAICFAHTDKNLFKNLIQTTISLDDCDSIIRKCTCYQNDDEPEV